MENNFVELDNLIDRFKSFLLKLELRALELETETIEAGQQINDLDEIRFIHFKAGITGQYETLKVKAKEIFKEQIEKKSFSYYYSDEDVRADDYMYSHDAKIYETSLLLDDFDDKIDSILENIFSQVKAESSEDKLKKLLAEYETTKNNFCCVQCGANLKIEKVYFVSAYVTCEFCQTQNTFVPSTRMSLLPDLVREIATEKTGILDYPIPGNSVFEKFLNNEKHARQQFFIKKNLIPELTDSYKEVYKRDISDFVQTFQHETETEAAFHQNIIDQFGTKFINQNLTINDLEKIDQLTFETLLNKELLSMNFMKEAVEKTTILTDLENHYQSLKQQNNYN